MTVAIFTDCGKKALQISPGRSIMIRPKTFQAPSALTSSEGSRTGHTKTKDISVFDKDCQVREQKSGSDLKGSGRAQSARWTRHEDTMSTVLKPGRKKNGFLGCTSNLVSPGLREVEFAASLPSTM
uniref:Uncharacterized protein n=1 Tax=Steinernema glaseri TaxID=37863 RepID=A0A1I7ZYS6_9BILA